MKLKILIDSQTLELLDDNGQLIKRYPVSTAKNGAGEQFGSYRTPRGRHYIRAKFGAGRPYAAVFRGRRWTGEVCTPALYQAQPERDWILSRILWLCGREPGFNRLGRVDTFRRYVYIHGTPDELPVGGPPLSHGCVRMRNADVIELYDLVSCGTDVEILEHEK